MNDASKLIGIAADHAGFELKEYILNRLIASGYKLIDYGNTRQIPDDDYPDYVIPLARGIARGDISRGIAICGSGVGACITANKVNGVRACLINETFSARQGVEDDDMNLICLGGLVTGHAMAWEVVTIFLSATFKETERYLRRLSKVSELENSRNR
ncbi:MAG TPA: ribose-5-phosphate isomerase [Sphingobacteriaceae bacterium]|nr:ribose-5-phosphate isomerase [Sphingobacteriaceae bacterium]